MAQAPSSVVSSLCKRPLVAVIGDGDLDHVRKAEVAEQIGRGLVDAGCRVVTGGLGGVMEAALRGAAASRAFRDGDTLALLPGADPAAANRWASIVIPTGLGHHRNGVVAAADAVVAVGGGAGTLSEVAFAWVWGRAPIVVVTGLPGVTASLAGQRLDGAAVGAYYS
ncbi:hypothetical protein MNEG_15625 [Monoraphidium neglectum]|uniref:TIGR00725 family protein n=1 Tax=Monoraphidium neglectum TaxID=145388 RepID=A0A0D2K866_9CHLO|nr:hypothetical protein MNEG_15625 [Monoraphidium neglectum]KIY92338.1 hypothetical protein MNEG_15625 [Monoraphidium neglectum]|eukprot:XP_013891358.1 hypothetical protein MNEG_15625 [Monoraphidium neglectum]